MHITKSTPALVLFTHSFPYGTGEQFLETEIIYLASRFRRVILVPSRLLGSPRSLPSNVEIETSLGQRWPYRLRRVLESALSCARSPIFYKELVTHPQALTHWESIARLVGYVGDFMRVRRWLLDHLSRAGLSLPDTIFYTYWLGALTLAIGRSKERYPEIRLISRAHGIDLYQYRHPRNYLPLREETLHSIDRLFTVSENGRLYLIEHNPTIIERCEVSRLGVGNPRVDTPCSEPGIFRISSCSSLFPVKCLPLLIEGLSALAELMPGKSLEWHHLGDGPLRPMLESLAKKHLSPSTRWYFHGQLTNQAVLEFYRTHPVDVFVNVSASEGVPVSIMEAQSFGIPVIAPAVGGVPEIVTGENGVLLKPNPTPREIALALQQLLSQDHTMAAKREASKATWRSTYHSETNYNAFADRIIEIIVK